MERRWTQEEGTHMEESQTQGLALMRASDSISDAKDTVSGVAGILASAIEGDRAGIGLEADSLGVLSDVLNATRDKLEEAYEALESVRTTE